MSPGMLRRDISRRFIIIIIIITSGFTASADPLQTLTSSALHPQQLSRLRRSQFALYSAAAIDAMTLLLL